MGDGEAETGPLATAWHSNKFLNPARDDVVLPILNLNGYIRSPTRPSWPASATRNERTYFFATCRTAIATASLYVMSTRSPTWTLRRSAGSRTLIVRDLPSGPLRVTVS